jgi:hypothetical protein
MGQVEVKMPGLTPLYVLVRVSVGQGPVFSMRAWPMAAPEKTSMTVVSVTIFLFMLSPLLSSSD